MKTLLHLLALVLVTVTSVARAQNSWYLHAHQPGTDNWNTLADWFSDPFVGTNPTAISSTDNFYSNGYQVRTPSVATASTFGGASLTVSSMINVKDTSSTTLTTIGVLHALGGGIVNATGGTEQVSITTLTNPYAFTISSGGSTRGINLAIGTLSGNGNISVAGAGNIFLSVTNALGFYGTLYLDNATTLTISNPLVSSGDFVVGAGTKVVLNASVTVTGLTVSGTTYAAGTYSFATLNAAYPAIFTSGTGSITVAPSASWYLHTSEGTSDNWNTLADWWSATSGGVHPTAINAADHFYTSPYLLRTPSGSIAATFGGAVLTVASSGQVLVKNTNTSLLTSIGNLEFTGGSLTNGTGSTLPVAITTLAGNSGALTLDTSDKTRGFDLRVSTLAGSGGITFSGHGGGKLLLNVADAYGYTGTLTLSGTSTGLVTFNNPLFTSGPLNVGTGNTVTLNQTIVVTGLTVGGVAKTSGTYTAAALGFTGSGSVTVLNRPRHLFGVNLSAAEGGTVPGSYGTNYTYPTQAEMNYYHGKGLNLIRVPFRWQRMQAALNGPLNTAELARMDQVIAWAHALGMQVMPDMHDYDHYAGNLIGSAAVPYSAYQDVWAKIAAHYVGETAIWGYDIMNEPNGTGGTWPIAAQAAVDGIRSADTVHFIVVEGDSYASAANWLTANPNLNINDPTGLIVYEAHSYWDSNASGQYAGTYDSNNAYPTMGIDKVAPFVTWLKAKHAWGMIGEYGVPKTDPRWNVVLDNFLQYLQQNNVSGTYWRGGPWVGNDPLSCEPTSNFTVDAAQMSVLQQYTQ